MPADHDDDLTAERTEGFKVGEKKTLDEYQKLGMYRLRPRPRPRPRPYPRLARPPFLLLSTAVC